MAGLIRPGAARQRRERRRPSRRASAALPALADWVRAAGCAQGALASTAVYWQPVDPRPAGQVAAMVVDARPLKAAPGRQTELKDAAWIAALLQHGLLRARSIPDRLRREPRALTRTRTTLLGGRAAAANRRPKVPEGASLKLTGVATGVMVTCGPGKTQLRTA